MLFYEATQKVGLKKVDFTFMVIRDPIDRALSAWFEINHRSGIAKFKRMLKITQHMHGKTAFNAFIDKMYNDTQKKLEEMSQGILLCVCVCVCV